MYILMVKDVSIRPNTHFNNNFKVNGVLEVHAKEFMLSHAKMLGLDNTHDTRLLQQLKLEEIDRLNKFNGPL